MSKILKTRNNVERGMNSMATIDKIKGLIDCALNQAESCMLDDSAKQIWLNWNARKTLHDELEDWMRIEKQDAVNQILTLLTQWAESKHGLGREFARSVLEQAELIKLKMIN